MATRDISEKPRNSLAFRVKAFLATQLGCHQPKSGAKVEYSSQTLRPRMSALHAMAAQVVIALFTREPIRSRRRVNITRVITGRGKTKLRTTWLITRVLVGLKPIAATSTAGIIVTTRRTQM